MINTPVQPLERWRLRPAVAADEGFLRRLYDSTRAQELAAWGWDAAAQSAFLDLQFRAQRTHHQRLWPQASEEIVLVDGQPAGRRLWALGESELRLIDIALLPECQGQGVGGALVQALMDLAAHNGLTLRLMVQSDGPAQRLYQRLGLQRAAGGQAPYCEMAWKCRFATGPTAAP